METGIKDSLFSLGACCKQKEKAKDWKTKETIKSLTYFLANEI